MDSIGVVFIIIITVCFLFIYSPIPNALSRSRSRRRFQASFDNLPGFHPSVQYLPDEQQRLGLAIDTERRKLAVAYPLGNDPPRVQVYDAEDLAGFEVLNNTTFREKSKLGRELAGAAVGGIVGAVAADMMSERFGIKGTIELCLGIASEGNRIEHIHIRTFDSTNVYESDMASERYRTGLDMASALAEAAATIAPSQTSGYRCPQSYQSGSAETHGSGARE